MGAPIHRQSPMLMEVTNLGFWVGENIVTCITMAVVKSLHPRPIAEIPTQLIDCVDARIVIYGENRQAVYAGFHGVVTLSKIC